jgi:hypothetical protein
MGASRGAAKRNFPAQTLAGVVSVSGRCGPYTRSGGLNAALQMRPAKKLMQTKPFKLGAVALANKMARVAFAIMRGKTTYSAAPA